MQNQSLDTNDGLRIEGAYDPPRIKDYGNLAELTAGCVGGIPDDAMLGADTEAFPANSGLFCE